MGPSGVSLSEVPGDLACPAIMCFPEWETAEAGQLLAWSSCPDVDGSQYLHDLQ